MKGYQIAIMTRGKRTRIILLHVTILLIMIIEGNHILMSLCINKQGLQISS